MNDQRPAMLQNRYVSLDVFRGVTICFMIIVNSKGFGATAFAPLLHAKWHGFTAADLVFPGFLFAVGNALSFAEKKMDQLGDGAFLFKVGKRSLLIFLLGFLMYWYPFFKWNDVGEAVAYPFSEARFMGVLQRIAICYFFAALLTRYLTRRAIAVFAVFVLVGYWALLYFLAPDPGDPYGATDNLVLRIDQTILGKQHMYHKYGAYFDPEGLLSTLPALVNVLIGYFAGKYLQAKGQDKRNLPILLLVGLALVLVALLWNEVFPVNKRLWTSSFACLTGGLSLIIMTIMVYAIEYREPVRHHPVRYFFLVFGRNPLFIYLLSEILYISTKMIRIGGHVTFYEWINTNLYQKLCPGAIGSLLFACSIMLLCWGVGYLMDRKKIYIKV